MRVPLQGLNPQTPTPKTRNSALVHLSRMPRIWQGYCSLLASMKKVTKARRAFDAALQSLPITQHHRVWELYLPWVKAIGVKETALRVYRCVGGLVTW